MSRFNKGKLGEVTQIQSGYSFKSSEFIQNGVPIIRIGNLNGESVGIDESISYSEQFWNENPGYRINKDDILVTMSGATVGKIGKYNCSNKALLNQRVGKLIPIKEKLNNSFLYFFVKSEYFVKKVINMADGCAQPNISIKQLEIIEIPLPTLENQKKIAEVLDKASSIISLRKKQIEKLDLLVKSRFIEMFGDPVINPMGWKVEKLKKLSTKIMSGNTPKGGNQVYVEKGITFFRSQNVWRNKLELDDIAYIDEETNKKMEKSSLKNRDILMTKTGRINTENSSLGRAAMYLGEDDCANINGHVYLIRLKKEIINEFVLFILTTDEYREYIRSVCVGGIDKRQINKEHLEEFTIILPPLELQNQFADFVQQVDKQKFELQKSLNESNTLLNALMQKYFG